MRNDILIISDELIEPPSEIMAIRTVTMISHESLEMNILLHTTQAMKDNYFHWMKPRGLMDYVDDIVNETEHETGVRIDIIRCHPNTIIVKSIRLENQISLLGKIKLLSGKV